MYTYTSGKNEMLNKTGPSLLSTSGSLVCCPLQIVVGLDFAVVPKFLRTLS